MRSRPRLVLVALTVLLVACSGGSASPPTTTVPPEPETSLDPAVTSSTVPITASTAPGRPRTVTTLPADISGGLARISGTVVGPAGPVPSANIRVERLLGTQVSTLNVTSTAAGQYNLPSVRGGSYRLRAWRAPDLVLLEPVTFFLGADEQKALDLRLSGVSDTNIQTAVDPSPIPKDAPFDVFVTVYAGSVTTEGAVQGTTRNGLPVQIVLRTNLALQSNDRVSTDNSGRAGFRVRCVGAGPAEADLAVGALRLPLSLPNCPA